MQQGLPQGLGHPSVAPTVPRKVATVELAQLDEGIGMNWLSTKRTRGALAAGPGAACYGLAGQ